MKKIIYIILFLATALSVNAQNKFNYKRDFQKLLKLSQDNSSQYFYPVLLKRFKQNDTTLTNYELIALQIGFVNKDYYRPYRTIDKEREIEDSVASNNYKVVIILCNKLLKTNPLNFTALMEKPFAYMKLGKDSVSYFKQKFMMLLNSIMTSGDGTKGNPFFVLSPIEGQLIITNILGHSIGFEGSGTNPDGYFVDILGIKGNTTRLYFNINHAMEKGKGLINWKH